ncbi:MAG: sugar phosphate isomerase/epimerase [Pirellulales bacterium]|nr:sugar phosphate isomerase/epimerase [Pirellulales bacterium]
MSTNLSTRLPVPTLRVGTGRFLAVIAPLLLIICASNAQAEEAAPPTRLQNPLAFRMANYGKFAAQGWSHLPALGVNYVFLDVPAAEDFSLLNKRLADCRLRPLVLRGNTDLGRESSVDELASQSAVCEKLGVKFMFISPKHAGVGKEAAYQRLRRAGEAAKKHGVTIVLETHPDLGTNADAHLETMRRIDHPNVRVNFDTGNVTFYNRGADAVAELKKIIDYVAAVELKDHNGKYMDWNFPALGKGVVDFPAVLNVLEEHGYRGPITIEVEGVKGVEMDEAETKRYIAESISYIKSLGDFR